MMMNGSLVKFTNSLMDLFTFVKTDNRITIMKTKFFARLAIVVALLVSFSMLTSCLSKEDRVISQLESLCKTVERDSFNAKDMDSAKAKFEAIHESAKDCNFTNEQLKEVAKLDARYAKAMAKKAVERVGNAVDGIIEGLSGDNE